MERSWTCEFCGARWQGLAKEDSISKSDITLSINDEKKASKNELSGLLCTCEKCVSSMLEDKRTAGKRIGQLMMGTVQRPEIMQTPRLLIIQPTDKPGQDIKKLQGTQHSMQQITSDRRNFQINTPDSANPDFMDQIFLKELLKSLQPREESRPFEQGDFLIESSQQTGETSSSEIPEKSCPVKENGTCNICPGCFKTFLDPFVEYKEVQDVQSQVPELLKSKGNSSTTQPLSQLSEIEKLQPEKVSSTWCCVQDASTTNTLPPSKIHSRDQVPSSFQKEVSTSTLSLSIFSQTGRNEMRPIPSCCCETTESQPTLLTYNAKPEQERSEVLSKTPTKLPSTESEQLCPCGCGYFVNGVDEICPCGCDMPDSPILEDSKKDAAITPDCDCTDDCETCGCSIEDKRKIIDAKKDEEIRKREKIKDSGNSKSRSMESTKLTRSSKDKRLNESKENRSMKSEASKKTEHTKLEQEARELQKRIESIKKENEQLRNLIENCRCSHDKTTALSQIPPIRATYSGLVAAIDILRTKCRSKDSMIAALAEGLRGSRNIEQVVKNLTAPCLEYTYWDFDYCGLYAYLRGTKVSPLNSSEITTKSSALSKESKVQSRVHIPPPIDFKVVREICRCLLVSWKRPESITNVAGYRILLNGKIVSHIRSPTRTEAVLGSVDISKPVELTLHAIGKNNQLSEPVTITYPFCKCDT